MQIIDMLSTMRREQKENHISYLKETKSLRDSAQMSINTDQSALVSTQTQLSPYTIANDHNAQNEKRE